MQLYSRVFQCSSEGIMVTNTKGRILTVNPAFVNITGYSQDEVIGQRPNLLKSGLHPPDFYIYMWADIHEKGSWQGEIRNRKKNGEIFLEWLRINAVKNDSGEITHYVGIFTDISEIKQSEENLRLYERVLNSSSEGIMITDTKGIILTVNPAFEQITGYSKDYATGKTPKILHSSHHDQEFYIHMWTAIHEFGSWEGEIWNRKKTGEVYPERLTINAVKDHEGKITNYVGIFNDISEKKQFEDNLHQLAHYDSLTGLPNRFLFHHRLSEAIEKARRHNKIVALLFLDLDRFKIINDTQGHLVGDQILKSVGEKLVNAIRHSDTVARMGGDEFTIVLTDLLHIEDVDTVALKIIESMQLPIVFEDQHYFVSPSIGISIYPDDGQDIETLIQMADAAMYSAKEQGNTYRYYTRDIHASISSKMELENGLRYALERSDFVLHYQKQVDIRTEQMSGLEALIRWNHPNKGLISPVEFIPLAEETGLIIPIGEWVLRSVSQQCIEWQRLGYPPVKIAVNVSVRQFQDPRFIKTIATILQESNLDPRYLELEITESVSMYSIQSVLKKLAELKKLGVRVVIDDFGTGYSSLGYLKRFPIDTIKIDRSFIKNIHLDPQNKVIVKSIVNLAHGLGLTVTAEGVEKQDELQIVKELGCDHIQGYIFSKPSRAEDLLL